MPEMELPETLQGAILYFANEENCHNLMVSMRWGNGPITCPHCNSSVVGKLVVSQRTTKNRTLKNGKFVKGVVMTRRLWNCSLCKKQFTLKTGSLFEDSPLGLDKWLTGLWLIVNAKNGVSSYEIAKAIGITQKSAWFLAQRLRLALHEGSFEKMSGTVESDESYIGAKARNMHKDKRLEKVKGTGPVAMTAVQGLLERGTRDSVSRVKLKVVKTTKKAEIQGNVREYVLKGSEVHTDALKSYLGLKDDFVHKVVDHAVCYVKDNVHTNGLENFWSLLKRTIKGTYVCPRPFHLFRYLDEQAFRFNERKDDDQGRFLKAAQSVKGRRLTYRTLTGKAAVAV